MPQMNVAWLQDSIAVLDDLLQHALEGLQVKAQLDTGSLSRQAPKQTAMKVLPHPPCLDAYPQSAAAAQPAWLLWYLKAFVHSFMQAPLCPECIL